MKRGRKAIRIPLKSDPGMVQFLAARGYPGSHIAKLFGVTPQAVYHALKFPDENARLCDIKKLTENAD